MEAMYDRYTLYKKRTGLPYSGYFSGGEIFVSCDFFASSWKIFRGRGI